MAFVDEITIYAKAGDGGKGIVSWRREKYRPKGGPAGGDGGRGGDVFFLAVRDLTRLAQYTARPKFKALNGGDGRRNSREGANQDPLYIEVPVGSIITHLETGESFQLLAEGETRRVLEGGRGGYGNEHFKSSRNTTPHEQTDGTPGEAGTFHIELQMLVDLGMVGLPSAGKSSLVNALSGSQMKTGAYHFTTLEPGLGMFHSYVLADIPGLIEGAAEGRGLGHKFLRHIKRTRALAHLVSFENLVEDPEQGMWKAYQEIRQELVAYAPELGRKAELVILSKTDTVSQATVKQQLALFEEKLSHQNLVALSILDEGEMEAFRLALVRFLESLVVGTTEVSQD